MRFDSTKAMETVEQLSLHVLPRSTAEARTAAFLAKGFERAGWCVEQLEASYRRLPEWLVLRARRPPEDRSPLIVARPSFWARDACRVVFLSDFGELPNSRGSGPALLLEMARSWPKGWSERFEPLLVAAGGVNFGSAGVREVVRLIREEWTKKATLLLVILAPGVGQELAIFGRPKALLRRAREAAENLWIPVEPAKVRPGMLMGRGWPVSARSCDHIVLRGSSYDNKEPTPVDPAALARAAQLASEIALRWIKQQNEQAS